jgi:hypothetical protein
MAPNLEQAKKAKKSKRISLDFNNSVIKFFIQILRS